jgi:hypothetical protein
MKLVKSQYVMPAQAGIQVRRGFLDSRLRGHDEMWRSISLVSLIEFLELTPMRFRGNDDQGGRGHFEIVSKPSSPPGHQEVYNGLIHLSFFLGDLVVKNLNWKT